MENTVLDFDGEIDHLKKIGVIKPPIIPDGWTPDKDDEVAISEIQERMYQECYIGHIPPDQWRTFAIFCYWWQRGSVTVG